MFISRIKYVILLSFLVSSIFAQTKKVSFRQHEIGVFLGGSYYIGDLNPGRHFYFTQPAIGLFYRYTPNYRYAFRGGFNFGQIMGDDSQSEDPDQLQRNLNFKSNIYDFHAIAEFNFYEYRISNDKFKFTTFLFLGLDVFRFKPQGKLNNSWVDLQSLNTEGQSSGYRLTQVGIPFGVGLKMNVSKQVGIGLEWGPRKTFTDYLDDVSGTYPDYTKTPFKNIKAQQLSDRSKNGGNNINKQRGNPRTKDWFVFFGLTINVKLNPQPAPCHAYEHDD